MEENYAIGLLNNGKKFLFVFDAKNRRNVYSQYEQLYYNASIPEFDWKTMAVISKFTSNATPFYLPKEKLLLMLNKTLDTYIQETPAPIMYITTLRLLR